LTKRLFKVDCSNIEEIDGMDVDKSVLVGFEKLSWNIQSSGVTEGSDRYMKGRITNYVLIPKATSC
jgi:hypothetical protein